MSRRLLLVCGLPEPILAAVRSGTLSSWAATRVMVPLARANDAHAERLLSVVTKTPLSTRQLQCWFEHYQGAQHAQRERLVNHPRLFLEALRAHDEQRVIERLRAGPEGEWARDCQRLLALIARLRSRLPSLVGGGLPEALGGVFERLCVALEALRSQLQRSLDHDRRADPPERAHIEGPRSQPTRDQSSAETLA